MVTIKQGGTTKAAINSTNETISMINHSNFLIAD